MPSRLSSLLVRDGLVGVKRMEQAFQRQVIYGGSLDTILLEMKLVPESRLLQYLSLSTGLPPAMRAETEVFDADAIKRCPVDLATAYRVVPLSIEDDALRVLVRDPVDLPQLEELANELEVPIQPLVVPEYRYHVVFDRTYDRETDARYSTLAKEAEEESAVPPVGKPKSVIIESAQPAAPAPDDDHVVVDVGVPKSESGAAKRETPGKGRSSTQRISTDALAQHLADTEKGRKEVDAARKADPEAAAEPEATADPEAAADPEAEPDAEPDAEIEDAALAEERDRVRALLDDETAPLSVADATALLEIAEERDVIFTVLLRAVRNCARFAGLLTIQGRVAIGRLAIDGDLIDRDGVSKVLIPLDDASAFANAVNKASPYIGPIASGDAETDKMLERLGGVLPPAALLLPVVLRNRVVALVVAHRGADTIGAAEVSGLFPLAGEAADAVSRLIMKAKAVGYRKADDAQAAPEVPADELPTTKHAQKKKTDWSAPDDLDGLESREIDFSTETSSQEDDEPAPIEAVLDMAEQEETNEDASREAIQEAIRRSDEALEAMVTRFPGKLRVDRYEMSGRVLRATEHGPMLEIVIQLGAAAADLLIDKMREPNRDVRYYATLCCAELRPRSALRPLVERLFDSDYGVRGLALDALSGYPARELDEGLEHARHALHSEDLDRVQAAAKALAELSDVRSIPDLLDATARGDESSAHTRKALVHLTKQNFGTSARKWRSWWNKNKRRNRVEWLIEALGNKDEGLRQSAADDLRRLTGEYFGYHHDLPKKERNQARQRWQRWWEESGRRRFLRQGLPERHRPTAVLPTRKN